MHNVLKVHNCGLGVIDSPQESSQMENKYEMFTRLHSRTVPDILISYNS